MHMITYINPLDPIKTLNLRLMILEFKVQQGPRGVVVTTVF